MLKTTWTNTKRLIGCKEAETLPMNKGSHTMNENIKDQIELLEENLRDVVGMANHHHKYFKIYEKKIILLQEILGAYKEKHKS